MINQRKITEEDEGAIGIGAMIVFIALILVAAVASAVIIQTAEKLQQNAQATGDDTADSMSGRIMVLSVYVDTVAAGDDYLMFFRLAAGSEPVAAAQVTYQLMCNDGAGNQVIAAGDLSDVAAPIDMGGSALTGGLLQPNVGYSTAIDGVQGGDCSADSASTADPILFLFVPGGGASMETFDIGTQTAGSLVV